MTLHFAYYNFDWQLQTDFAKLCRVILDHNSLKAKVSVQNKLPIDNEPLDKSLYGVFRH